METGLYVDTANGVAQLQLSESAAVVRRHSPVMSLRHSDLRPCVAALGVKPSCRRLGPTSHGIAERRRSGRSVVTSRQNRPESSVGGRPSGEVAHGQRAGASGLTASCDTRRRGLLETDTSK